MTTPHPAAGPRVLVAFASRHGSTEAIAIGIATRLAQRGCICTTRSAELVDDVSGFDACIIGSAVYLGRWMPAARDLVSRHRDALLKKAVWLFSSGPIGEPARPLTDPIDASAALADLQAVDHLRFAGRLDRASLSFPERIAVQVVGAPDGDFRDWDAINAWADGIADNLALRQAEPLRFGT